MCSNLEEACVEFVSALSDAATWHQIVTRCELSNDELIVRVVGMQPDLCVFKSHFTIFTIHVPFHEAPRHLLRRLTTLVRMRGFESETMSSSYEFKWKAFKLNSFLNSKIDRCALIRQCAASRRVEKDVFKNQLQDLLLSSNYFVRQRAAELKRSLRSSSIPRQGAPPPIP